MFQSVPLSFGSYIRVSPHPVRDVNFRTERDRSTCLFGDVTDPLANSVWYGDCVDAPRRTPINGVLEPKGSDMHANLTTILPTACAIVGLGASLPTWSDPDPVSGVGEQAQEARLPEVQVEVVVGNEEGTAASGYRTSKATVGLLGNQSLQDTPYSISVVPSALIENIQASNATDALRYDPRVNPDMGSNRSGDYFTIRGFVNSSNQAIDGMRSELAYGILEDKERIEVLSGATSFLYGLASPAGMINYVLKRPTIDPQLKVTVGDGGGTQLYTHIDAGGPIDAEGRFGYRLNQLGVDDGNTGIDVVTRGRYQVSGAFDWHLAPTTTLSLDASRFHDKLDHAQAYFLVGAVTGIPDAPDAAENYSAPYSYTERTYDTFGLKLVHEINSALSLRSQFRHGRSEQMYMGIRNQWVDDSGRYNQQMYYYLAPNVTQTNQGNLFLDARFATGPVTHQATLGYNLDSIEEFSAGTKRYYFPASRLFSMSDPGYSVDPDVATSGHAYVSREVWRESLVLADELGLGDHWSLLLGASYVSIDDENYSTSNGDRTSDYDDGAVTPSLALMFKPNPQTTVYASYIEALEEGATAPSTAANADEVLNPFRSNQYEVGAKVRFAGMDLNTAFFRIDKAAAYTDPVTKVYSDDGREVHQGLEVSFSGKVTERLTLLGGFSVLDATIEKTSTAAVEGKTPQAVPDRVARLYGEYALPQVPGLIVTGGLSYTDRIWANDANTLSLPSVVTADLGLRYQTTLAGKTTTWRLGVTNLTDESYWTTKGGSMLYLGSPRTLAASVAVEF